MATFDVQFTDTSTGVITSRLWDFGDGATSTLANPLHTYAAAGTYTVTLTVYGLYGDSDSDIQRVSRFLLQVDFTTPQAAPLSVYAGEYGSITFTDPGGLFSVVGGQLVWSASSGGFTSAFQSLISYARAAGVTLFMEWQTSARVSNAWNIGADISLDRRAGADQNSAQLNATYYNGAAAAGINSGVATVVNTTYQFAIVLRSNGAFYFIKGGAFASWTLFWIDASDSTAQLFAEFLTITGSGFLNYVWVALIKGAFTTDTGIATLIQNNPADATPYVGSADAINRISGIVLPAVPIANQVTASLLGNYLDANNYNVYYLRRNAANTNYDFRFDTVVAGVATNRINVASVGNDVAAIRVRHVGSLHDCWTGSAAGVVTKRGGQINNANQSATTGIEVLLGGSTIALLEVYPINSANYLALDV